MSKKLSIGTIKKELIDKISNNSDILLGDMATELYPDRYNYGNHSYIIEKQSVYGKFTQPERAIMFTIE